jgi:hypothetical protein
MRVLFNLRNGIFLHHDFYTDEWVIYTNRKYARKGQMDSPLQSGNIFY